MAESRFTFHRKKFTLYPGFTFILAHHTKTNEAILRHVNDIQGQFKDGNVSKIDLNYRMTLNHEILS